MLRPFFRKLLIALALLLVGLCAFGQVRDRAFQTMLNNLLQHSVPEISPKEAQRILGQALFVDAREPREFAVSHLKGALALGYDHPEWHCLDTVSKRQPIVVYCSVGYRSEKIAEQLLRSGFIQVYNLYGGIFEWANQGYTVYNDQGITHKIHAFDRKWGIWLQKGEKVY